MTGSVSTLGMQLLTTGNLQTGQTSISFLAQQLATGKKFVNLTDYAPSTAHNLMDFQNAVTLRQSYIASMQTLDTRLQLYDRTMNDIERIAAQAKSLASTNQSLDPGKIDQLRSQVQSYLKQLTDDINQQVGGRYIYAGTRYSTKPVIDLSTLTGAPTWPFTATDSPTLPSYDSEYDPPTTTDNAAAFAIDVATIGPSFTLSYGVTSSADGFQELIAGLQFLNDAMNQTDPDDYHTGVTRAATLLGGALPKIQGLHSGVANNINTLKSQMDIQNSDITSLQNQITDMQKVDLTEVGARITLMQTQLQASFSATATISRLTILSYLS